MLNIYLFKMTVKIISTCKEDMYVHSHNISIRNYGKVKIKQKKADWDILEYYAMRIKGTKLQSHLHPREFLRWESWDISFPQHMLKTYQAKTWYILCFVCWNHDFQKNELLWFCRWWQDTLCHEFSFLRNFLSFSVQRTVQVRS